LLDLARAKGLLVCSGHQLLRDSAFERLLARAPELGTLVQVDSHFAFRPVGSAAVHAGPRSLAAQLIDILPHPLYALVAVLERFGGASDRVEVVGTHASASDLQVLLRAGELIGRLSVSLRARPVASSLTLMGTKGLLSTDFVRSTVVGAANPGTEVLEKILNPMLEGAQLLGRTALSLPQRLRSGGSYPGLAELIGDFYRAVGTAGASPVSPEHLLRVTDLFETFAAKIETAARRPEPATLVAASTAKAPVVVTGARGFLGARIARSLDYVRGIGRTANPDDPNVNEWIVADLGRGLAASALEGASVVIHAAAETCGGYEAHQRNTIDATRHLLRAMQKSGVSRLVLVSSLSVLRPPRTPWECQDERTPRPLDARPFGAYSWGKSEQEALVEREAAALGVMTRIVRPGALIDSRDPILPGLIGRRLFGRWHLGLGRPGLPTAVCDVDRCAQVVAWCATHFDEAPAIVNLFDPRFATRGSVAEHLRSLGWNGRMIWVPISAIAAGLSTARTLLALARGRWPERMAAWSILRPRRFDARLSAELLEESHRPPAFADATVQLSA